MVIAWKHYTNPCDAKAVADKVLEDWDDVCNELGITHFLVLGTCLGFHRDQGYMQRDHDIDVGVVSTDEQFAILIERLREIGFTGVPPYPDKVLHRSGVVLDIWKVRQLRKIGPFVQSFDSLTYNGRVYKVPHPVEAYLEHCYGKEWVIPK